MYLKIYIERGTKKYKCFLKGSRGRNRARESGEARGRGKGTQGTRGTGGEGGQQ
jgi:hypothetical protein